MIFKSVLLFIAATLILQYASADIPKPGTVASMGVNIHFTDPRPGEMKELSAAGFKWIRMDFNWAGIEKSAGVYDFSAYDVLMRALKRYRIRPIFILDYANPLYDNNQSPHSPEAIAAFAKWAAASAVHFKGDGVLWEMYNEPNGGFWRPHPDVKQYARLALATGKAIKAADPNAMYIGPGMAGMDFQFAGYCFMQGLLKYWDAVSCHPYRQSNPETVSPDYLTLRNLIHRFAPKGKHIPIISSEWGYSSVWGNMNPDKQGRYLPREFLTNISNDIPVSIYYDWHDDGLSPTDPEHHFGTVLNPYHAGANRIYDPKPAYIAAKTLSTQLDGYAFSKRLIQNDSDIQCMLFTKGKSCKLVIWTTGKETTLALPGSFKGVNHLGDPLDLTEGADGKTMVQVTNAPHYLTPARPTDWLKAASGWERAPLDVMSANGDMTPLTLRFRNELGKTVKVRNNGEWITVRPNRTADLRYDLKNNRAVEFTTEVLPLEVSGVGSFTQQTSLVISNPIQATLEPVGYQGLMVQVQNPSGGEETLEAMLNVDSGSNVGVDRFPIIFGKDEKSFTRFFPFNEQSDTYSASVTMKDTEGRIVAKLPDQQFSALTSLTEFYDVPSMPSALNLQVYPDGDPKIGSTQKLSDGTPEMIIPGHQFKTVKITYTMDTGWKFLRIGIADGKRLSIQGKPTAFGIWVKGDGQGSLARLRFTDSSGQTFQPSGPTIDFTGWRYMQFPMNGNDSGHWGGPNDGIVHYPIHWDSIFLLDGGGKAMTGAVEIAAPMLIYSGNVEK